VNEKYLLTLYLIGTMTLTLFAISLVVFLVVHKQRQSKFRLEKQELQFRYEKDMLQLRLDVKEQSMTLISEEIHDNVGQLLSLTRMYVASLGAYVTDPQGKDMVVKSTNLVAKAIEDLRHISHSLNSDLIQRMGLVTFLEREMEYLGDSATVKCTLTVTGTPRELEREQNLLISRIVQESIQNVVKHAEATRLDVTLAFDPAQLAITIKDDGKGFDLEQARKSESLGLRNIYNRAHLLRGTIDIQSAPGAGSSIHLVINPMNK
jgi:signal transduction histidine kinase